MLQKLIGLAATLALVVTAACTQTDADLAKAVQDRFVIRPHRQVVSPRREQ